MYAVGSERLCMGYLVSRAIYTLGLSTASTYTALPNGGYTSISVGICKAARKPKKLGVGGGVRGGGGARWWSGVCSSEHVPRSQLILSLAHVLEA